MVGSPPLKLGVSTVGFAPPDLSATASPGTVIIGRNGGEGEGAGGLRLRACDPAELAVYPLCILRYSCSVNEAGFVGDCASKGALAAASLLHALHVTGHSRHTAG